MSTRRALDKGGMMITKEMIIGDIIRKHPRTLTVFAKYGLDCNECQIADFEELEHGAGVHKVNVEQLLRELNEHIDSDTE
jgi:hybrid cluster-associated redox disulfide protein